MCLCDRHAVIVRIDSVTCQGPDLAGMTVCIDEHFFAVQAVGKSCVEWAAYRPVKPTVGFTCLPAAWFALGMGLGVLDNP